MVQSYGYFAIYANFAHHKGYTRPGGTTPANDMLQTSFRRPHTNSPIKDEIHGARGRPYLSSSRGRKSQNRRQTFAGADDNVCRGG